MEKLVQLALLVSFLQLLYGSLGKGHLETLLTQEILERDGLNELEKPPKPTLLLLFLMQCLGCSPPPSQRGLLL